MKLQFSFIQQIKNERKVIKIELRRSSRPFLPSKPHRVQTEDSQEALNCSLPNRKFRIKAFWNQTFGVKPLNFWIKMSEPKLLWSNTSETKLLNQKLRKTLHRKHRKVFRFHTANNRVRDRISKSESHKFSTFGFVCKLAVRLVVGWRWPARRLGKTVSEVRTTWCLNCKVYSASCVIRSLIKVRCTSANGQVEMEENCFRSEAQPFGDGQQDLLHEQKNSKWLLEEQKSRRVRGKEWAPDNAAWLCNLEASKLERLQIANKTHLKKWKRGLNMFQWAITMITQICLWLLSLDSRLSSE